MKNEMNYIYTASEPRYKYRFMNMTCYTLNNSRHIHISNIFF